MSAEVAKFTFIKLLPAEFVASVELITTLEPFTMSDPVPDKGCIVKVGPRNERFVFVAFAIMLTVFVKREVALIVT